MKDEKDDTNPDEIPEEEMVVDLDHESLDEQIIGKLGGKKRPSDGSEHDDVVDEEETSNPNATIKKLREELKAAKQERMDTLTSWQKDKADFLNARKRDQETQSDVIRFANQALIADLLPTLDGYEQAKSQPTWSAIDETWRKGVESLMSKVYSSLQKVGVEAYGAIGDAFEPSLHEAIGNEPTTDKTKDHTVSTVMQRGYTLHGKVVRPALVKVFQV